MIHPWQLGSSPGGSESGPRGIRIHPWGSGSDPGGGQDPAPASGPGPRGQDPILERGGRTTTLKDALPLCIPHCRGNWPLAWLQRTRTGPGESSASPAVPILVPVGCWATLRSRCSWSFASTWFSSSVNKVITFSVPDNPTPASTCCRMASWSSSSPNRCGDGDNEGDRDVVGEWGRSGG